MGGAFPFYRQEHWGLNRLSYRSKPHSPPSSRVNVLSSKQVCSYKALVLSAQPQALTPHPNDPTPLPRSDQAIPPPNVGLWQHTGNDEVPPHPQCLFRSKCLKATEELLETKQWFLIHFETHFPFIFHHPNWINNLIQSLMWFSEDVVLS